MNASKSILSIATSWGPIKIEASNGEVTACHVSHKSTAAKNPLKILKSRVEKKGTAKDGVVLKNADVFIRGLFKGDFQTPPKVRIPDGTAFQQKVWKLLYNMKPGQTISYGQLAKKAGSPKAFRAAGQACGANQIPLFIPCHRIVTSDGRLGGFSCGLAWKELLLGIESGNNRRSEQSRRRST